MQRKNGVYALVMRLEKDRTIEIGKLGVFDFERGWYVYLGSAHGSGGVKARTDRHCRDGNGKKYKWNVDYLRTFAPVTEIWYSYAPRYREHDWASKTLRMHGAFIPVQKFGANDCPYCDAHLFYFERRPFPAAFRADLFGTHPEHQPVFTEFVKPFDSDPVCLSENAPATLNDYACGRRVLEQFRVEHGSESELTATELAEQSVAKGSPMRRLVDAEASAMRVSVEKLIADVQFAAAVEVLVSNSDKDVYQAIFNSGRPQAREGVMQLSRTADIRQRYRIEGVLGGRLRAIAPQRNDPVFDTVKFDEVTSRLARARGTLEKLVRHRLVGSNAVEVAETTWLVKLCGSAAGTLKTFSGSATVTDADIPVNLSKEVVWPRLMSREVTGQFVGEVRGALRLTIKNVWDYPEMHRRGIVPTAEQVATVSTETAKIARVLKVLLSSLCGDERI